MDITTFNKKSLLSLNPKDVKHRLSAEEIIYMAKLLGAFWSYDYQAAKEGRPGKHALLKSGLCSDGFFVSRILLSYPNIMTIIANQMVQIFKNLGMVIPDKVVGIPTGATELGIEFARILGVPVAEMEKQDGRIIFIGGVENDDKLLLVEDFCTSGAGFTEAVLGITSQKPEVYILPIEMLILNRGGLTIIPVQGVNDFQTIAVATHKINSWEASECPLCNNFGSIPIKPKETDANWTDITTSQLITE